LQSAEAAAEPVTITGPGTTIVSNGVSWLIGKRYRRSARHRLASVLL